MMSHRNIVAACTGIAAAVQPSTLTQEDVYIAYLPLAHVLELVAENALLTNGAAIGYSSPFTLRDDSVNDAESGRPAGDLSTLRPTVMAAVPLILDRLRGGITEQVNKSGPIKKNLFKLCYYLKERAWLQGKKSPLLDKIIFSKIAAKFGGRLRAILSGGAPLGAETQRFMNIAVCCPILQGYGLTETLGGGTLTHMTDSSTGNVGGPVGCTEIKLLDVPEMGYNHDDLDEQGNTLPRGEIAIGGVSVAQGYYALDASKNADFFVDSEGIRWFKTGDIGQWNADGTLSIIDRKKDLVKLAHGEYIALGNLESKYSRCDLLDNVCVYGDSHHQRPIVVAVPNHKALESKAAQLGISNSNDIHALCNDEKIKKAVLGELEAIAKKHSFAKWEIPAAAVLLAEPWSPESGLVTEAMKLRRHEINKKFKKEIDEAYKTVSNS
jgi:long-chain acyl-CoA synthetase